MKATIGLLLGLSLTGCVNSVNTIERENPQARPNTVQDSRVVTDTTLDRKLGIVSLNESQVSGDLLKVQATIANSTAYRKRFAYCFDWIADDGMELTASASTWRLITLEGGEQKSISAVSKSPLATDFRLKFQER